MHAAVATATRLRAVRRAEILHERQAVLAAEVDELDVFHARLKVHSYTNTRTCTGAPVQAVTVTRRPKLK